MSHVTRPDQVPAAVSAVDIELRFGSVVAIARSDFVVPSSGVTAVIGPNGSGKSTLLAAIAGIHRPTAGSITVLGGSPSEVRSRVAFVPQSTKVNDALPVTVREVVGMGRYASLGILGRWRPPDRAAVDAALERLDLERVAGRHLRELSGGQRQRVFVAQGLVQDRDLLMLDEPVNALDLVSADVIRSVITEEAGAGRPVVFTTHDLGDARRSDHVILLSQRVVAQGAPGEVLTPDRLETAYHVRIASRDEHWHIDDAAHRASGVRHLHVDPARYDAPRIERPTRE